MNLAGNPASHIRILAGYRRPGTGILKGWISGTGTSIQLGRRVPGPGTALFVPEGPQGSSLVASLTLDSVSV